MHAFMSAVLLGAARANALMENAEAHPPDVEVGETADHLCGERHAMVGANRERETVLAERGSNTGRAVSVLVESSP